MVYCLFYELVRVALGNQRCLSKTPTEKEWRQLFAMAEKQAIDGITYDALAVLAKHGQKPTVDVLLDWFSYAKQIKEQNKIINQRCKDVTELFTHAGFKTCILKGQGNALMYPNPLSRVSGDIDIWVKGNRKDIKNFVISQYPDAVEDNKHIQFPVFQDIPVEVHYKPRYSSVPKYEKRLQIWFEEQADIQFNNFVSISGTLDKNVCVPTPLFNFIQQMSHMMGHFISEGLGMRHLIDYYFVLKFLDTSDDIDYVFLFKHLGMYRFASGIMWIEHTVLGLDEKLMLVPESEKIGIIILEEVMSGGNFGHNRKENSLRNQKIFKRGLIDIKRLLKFFSVQPSEVLFRILYKLTNIKSFKEAINQIFS